jgi:hypothetical protein
MKKFTNMNRPEPEVRNEKSECRMGERLILHSDFYLLTAHFCTGSERQAALAHCSSLT